jgi:hypothetical protein
MADLVRVPRPELIVSDASPLIHLAAGGALDVLNRMASRVVLVDIVEIEATFPGKPFAEDIRRWIDANKAPTGQAPVTVEETEIGRTFALARKADPNYKLRNAGEIAILEWLFDKVEGTQTETMILYENGKVPRRIERQGYDANIAVATTRAFLRIAQELALIPSAEEVWKEIEKCATPNPEDRVFLQRRTTGEAR